MFILRTAGLVLVATVWLPCQEAAAAEAAQAQTPFTISKATTYFTEPVTDDGLIDYANALNRRFSQGVTAENNAAVPLYRALGPKPSGVELPPEFFRWLKIAAPPEQGTYFVAYKAFLTSQPVLAEEPALRDAAVDQLNKAMSRPWQPQDLPLVAEWLEKYEAPLDTVVEGTRRPRYFVPLWVERPEENEFGGLISALLPGISVTRGVGRALVCRAMRKLGSGDPQAAWQDLLACHRLARRVSEGPTLIEALVGMAIDGVAARGSAQLAHHAELSGAQWQRCQKELAQLKPLAPVAEKIDLGERAMFLDAVQRLASGRKPSQLLNQGPSDQNIVQRLIWQLTSASVDWDEPMRMGNQWYDRLAEAMSEPDYVERQRKLDAWESAVQDLAKEVRDPWVVTGYLLSGSPRKALGETLGKVLLALMLPAVKAAREAEDRSAQRARNTEVMLALAAYRAAHGGYPERLSALRPDYLAEVPVDLFTGESLRYEASGRGYLLYSVGPNGEDDQGRERGDKPAGDDIAVRMPPTREGE